MRTEGAFSPLVAFWLRQYLPIVRRVVLSFFAVGVLVYITGNADADFVSALLVGGSFGFIVPATLFIFQSKASGDFEMITELPVPPSVISASVAAATTIVVLPGALSLAIGATIGLGMIGVAAPPFLFLLIGGWMVLWLVSWMFSAMSTALTPEAFVNGPAAMFGVLFLLGAILPDPDPQLVLEWLSTPAGAWLAGACGIVVFLGGAFGFHLLTCRGIVRYEATPVPPMERWTSRPWWRLGRS